MYRFVDVIFTDLWEGFAAEIKAAHFLSVLSDSSTDVSGRDLEGVFVRILSHGQPKNIFIGVEELQHATAPGHYAAMSTALDKADLSQWNEKVVGLGTDGAAVMVGRLGGVTTLLRLEVPHLINIQCLGHGLELAALDAMKDHERTRKVMDILKGLYKQYHHSPKVWRELRDVLSKGLETHQRGRDTVAPAHREGTQSHAGKLSCVAC
ncbi:zinc finger protein 862-like [Epinephelus moara]|uniref:zinc finger protein 862-like n=1 Tax=Epinephelus moara TaxID=300413 RepID=UPI00214F27E5|nr:zinc finger protein 862-like [Epinephelus moara]